MYWPHPLFDPVWYVGRHPEVLTSGQDPLSHYLEEGDARGWSPHALFDPAYYSAQYPEVSEAGGARLVHYCEIGGRAGASPHRHFDGSWYLERHPEVARSGQNPLVHYLTQGEAAGLRPNPIFDPTFYRRAHPDLEGMPSLLSHYVAHGMGETRFPCALFDPTWYTTCYPDVASSGLDPITHYLTLGDAAGLRPHPLFDPAHYGEQHPELPNHGGARLAHYLTHGVHGTSDPHPLFDSKWYIAKALPAIESPCQGEDEAAIQEGETPLAHYLRIGDSADAAPHPLFDPLHYSRQHPELPRRSGIRLSHFSEHDGQLDSDPHPLFDLCWYRDTQMDEGEAAVCNPLLHFLRSAGETARRPCPHFDSEWYRSQLAEPLAAETTPLEHYLREGIAALRAPNPLFDVDDYLARHPDLEPGRDDPLAHLREALHRGDASPHPLFDCAWYREQHPEEDRGGLDPYAYFLLVGLSTDDPHPLFDSAWYREQCELAPEAVAAYHYLHAGGPVDSESEEAPAPASPHPLFDPAWYAQRVPEILASGEKALVHYLRAGDAEDVWPNPLFDPAFVSDQLPHLPRERGIRLSHYSRYEERANGRRRAAREHRAQLRPHALFDPTGEYGDDPDVRRCGRGPLAHLLHGGSSRAAPAHPLFDPDWYLEEHPEAADSELPALAHYAHIGSARGWAPHPLFDVAWYRTAHLRRAGAPVEPLAHFTLVGARRGLEVNPLFDSRHYRREAGLAPGEVAIYHYARHGAERSPHPLFDLAWYLTAEPEAESFGFPPLAHYLRRGDARNTWPNALFDPEHYSRQYPELPRRGGHRLAHYVREGARAGAEPNVLFREAWYRSREPAGLAEDESALVHYVREGEARGVWPHPLFDPAWYHTANPDVGPEPDYLAHYLHHGSRELRSTCCLFDGRWYDEQRSRIDDAEPELAPIEHYLAIGDELGLSPHPLFDPAFYGRRHPELECAGGQRLLHFLARSGEAVAPPHPLFDPRFYVGHECPRGAGEAPASSTDENPLAHYLRVGEARGLRPHPLFDPAYYLRRNPDLHNHPRSLLVHFELYGHREGRKPNPLFDPHWYREQHPQLAPDDERNPLTCYIARSSHAAAPGHEAFGSDVVEGTDVPPHPLFDGAWYREAYDEVRASELDPLTHFLLVGSAKGLEPHPFFDSGWYRQRYGLPPDLPAIAHYADEGAAAGLSPAPLFDVHAYLADPRVRPLPGESALAHFAREGWRIGARPGPLFDFCLRFFRDRDPGLRAPGCNPFAGYFSAPFAALTCPEAEVPIDLPAPERPRVSVVIPAFGSVPYTLACLRAIAAARCATSFEVIVVDDGVDTSVGDPLAQIDELVLIRNPENRGFLRSANLGAERARGEYLVFLNNDTLVQDDWLDALIGSFDEFPDVGIVGSRLLHANGRLQEAGSLVFRDGSAMNRGWGSPADALPFTHARAVDYVSAAAMMIPRHLFESLGGFDPVYAPAFYEDTDLCFKARASGRSVYYQPASRVVHFGGVSHGLDLEQGLKRHQNTNRAVFVERWAHQLELHAEADWEHVPDVTRRPHGCVLVMDSTTLTPDRDSGSVRMFNLLRILRDLGFEVTFVPADLGRPEPYTANLEKAGIKVLTTPDCESIERFLERDGRQFDLCILSRPIVGGCWLDTVKLLCPRAVVLYDTVDLHFLRREREMRLLGASHLSESDVRCEIESARGAHGVLVVSEQDRQHLSEIEPGLPIHILSNIHACNPSSTPFEERSGLLFIGGFRHTPNGDGVHWFVAHVLPKVLAALPELRFHIVGSEIPPDILALASPNVIIEGHVEDVAPLFSRCKMSVAPLRYGAGVKGKVNQSMSFGLPCVATSIAAEGMEARDGEEIVIADDPDAFAERILELERDRGLWERISRGSLESVERTFGLAVTRERVREILKSYDLL